MIRTRVGYAGGRHPDPTYHDLGDHTETLQIDFDPARISYADLLKEFFRAHTPTRPAWSVQYRSAILSDSPAQRAAAEKAREAFAAEKGKPVFTDLEPLGTFHRAEDYHQKYRLRADRGLMAFFDAAGYDARAFTDSTAAAKLNGYVSGYGSEADLAREIGGFGLPPATAEALAALVRAKERWR